MAQRKSKKISRRGSEALNDDDRLSRLPDDLIQHIFSFIDTKHVVQSSALSRNWRDTWKSQSQLSTEIIRSPNRASGSKFPDFVHKFLTRRDAVAKLSTIDFRSNFIGFPLVREIISYAMSHKTRKLRIEFSGDRQTIRGELDSSLLRSQHLEQLFLRIGFGLKVRPPLIWDFPALTTLSISRAKITLDDASKSIDLFSQFPNLKTLALDACFLFNIDTFIINSSELETLSLKLYSPSCKFVVSAPKLSSFTYSGVCHFPLSAKNLVSLKTVKFQTIYDRFVSNEAIDLMINSFNQFHNTQSLAINLDTLEVLSIFLRSHGLQNRPFTRLQSLTVLSSQLPLPSTVSPSVIDYFMCSSRHIKIHIEHDPTPWRIWL
ncbi:FBD-associated F-box protein At5g60610-like [Bidens hawaiensis]|uniref:FBD-associated F-box protein At5g60610-like n=1 Tax=Bidens hawaiensis TaxID=980011 RepID=UPI0040499434